MIGKELVDQIFEYSRTNLALVNVYIKNPVVSRIRSLGIKDEAAGELMVLGCFLGKRGQAVSLLYCYILIFFEFSWRYSY